jgi:hypothetical protein
MTCSPEEELAMGSHSRGDAGALPKGGGCLGNFPIAHLGVRLIPRRPA